MRIGIGLQATAAAGASRINASRLLGTELWLRNLPLAIALGRARNVSSLHTVRVQTLMLIANAVRQ